MLKHFIYYHFLCFNLNLKAQNLDNDLKKQMNYIMKKIIRKRF